MMLGVRGEHNSWLPSLQSKKGSLPPWRKILEVCNAGRCGSTDPPLAMREINEQCVPPDTMMLLLLAKDRA